MSSPSGPSFIRMFVGGRGVLVSLLAMFVSRFGVLLPRLCVLAEVMVMGCPNDGDARQRGDERRPDDDAHWPDASGTLPWLFLPTGLGDGCRL